MSKSKNQSSTGKKQVFGKRVVVPLGKPKFDVEIEKRDSGYRISMKARGPIAYILALFFVASASYAGVHYLNYKLKDKFAVNEQVEGLPSEVVRSLPSR